VSESGDKRASLRILLGAATTMGPGKASLLDAVAATGSISAAARQMGMSYRRAWLLVDEMNRDFRAPLVVAAAGGAKGGGAHITDAGRDALRRYREMEKKAAEGIAREIAEFATLLVPAARG
jgi:molybdate transport system regulatory protein